MKLIEKCIEGKMPQWPASSLARLLDGPIQLCRDDHRKHPAEFDDKPPERGRVGIADEQK